MALPKRTTVRRPICTLVAGAIVFAALAVAMAGASAAGSAPRSSFPDFLLDRGRYTAFDAPEAVFATLPYGINDRGQIVGRYNDASSEQGLLRDKAGRFTNIKIRGAQSAWAVNINNRGQIVSYTLDATGTPSHSFLLSRGVYTTIEAPGVPITNPLGINDRARSSAARSPMRLT
jgi:hypothetical protein